MRIGHTNFNPSVIGVGATVGLGALGLALVYPITGIGVHAEEAEIKPFSAAVQTNVSTYVRSSIAVSLAGEVEVDLNPTSKGTFSESSGVDLSVTTNNTSGYAVYLATGDNSGALIQRSPAGGEGRIAPVQGSMTAANYTSHLDSWGYNIANGENTNASVATASGVYAPIPGSSSSPVIQTNSTSSDDSYTLRFGVAISPSLPAGVYNNTVVALVVANPIEVRSLTDLTTMQEMTPEICAISYENESKQLIDARDNNAYTVTKLKDGNCWMTDNLALTSQGMTAVKGNSTLTPADSDVEGEWELPETKTETGSWTTNNAEAMSMNINNGYGTYFTFQAATAGKGSSVTGSQEIVENSSVCPKGWKLPLSGSNYNNTSGSFYYLLDKYGVSAGTTEERLSIVTGDLLNFQRGGCVLSSGKLSYVGTSGYYWSSVSDYVNYAYGLYFDRSTVNSSGGDYRYIGESVRCLAK